jgi:magnesium and cobalt exporter, CNNM family
MPDAVEEVLVIVALVALNAVFVAAEIALVTVHPWRLERLAGEGQSAARRARSLIANPARFLAVIQLGITFIGFLASAYAAVSLTLGLERTLAGTEALAPYSEILSLVAVTGVLSVFTIIFGELVPKAVALRHSEGLALALAGPVELLARLLAPIVWFLAKATSVIARGADDDRETALGSEEIRLLVERSREQGGIEADEGAMIGAVFGLGQHRVHEVMVPRTEITAVPATASLPDAVHRLAASGRSRLPAYEGSLDYVVGILHARDVLGAIDSGRRPGSISTILREPVFVPRSALLDDALHVLMHRHSQLALVLDEYGGTAGLVTVEDILEEVVGEIHDEFDREPPMATDLGRGRVRLDGRAGVGELVERFGEMDAPRPDKYDTVGGLVYHELRRVPAVGDQIRLGPVLLTVETLAGRRVGSVVAEPAPAADPPATADGGGQA